MKVALVGATGFIGQHILVEALSREHQVTALVRNPQKISPAEGLVGKAVDLKNSKQLINNIEGHDAVIISVHHDGLDLPALIDAVKVSRVPRLLVVGGAGSLEIAPGMKLIDSPQFPAEWKAVALAAQHFLDLLRAEDTLNWTYLSPSALIEPGQRTGKFRLGSDKLIVNEKGESKISNQDYA
ncbi:MAG: NAD-dependent epimerase/dehydratase family protein, partial [Moraxellaceae bacterium]